MPSPSSSNTARTTPPRYLPPHLHEEVLPSKEFAGSSQSQQEGQSPSGAFAEITIDCGSSVDMSGSENGSTINTGTGDDVSGHRAQITAGRILGPRSASPAKRRAAEMENGRPDDGAHESALVPGSFASIHGDTPTDYEDAMAAMTPATNSMEATDTVPNSFQSSAQGTLTQNTSTTSLASEELPPYEATSRSSQYAERSTEKIDEDVRKVHEMMQKPFGEGDKAVLISTRWLARVLSRASDGQKNSEYPKEAREGPIGPVDISDIVPSGAFDGLDGILLKDTEGREFVPLKPGLSIGQEFEVLNDAAWGYIVGEYGYVKGQKQIDRYAHDTAPEGASSTNVQVELYPPVFTLRKVPQPVQEEEEKPHDKSREAAINLRLKKERRSRGQMSPDDAVRLVSSRSEKFQKFLARSKEYAGIPLTRKVKLWRLLDARNVAIDKPDTHQPGVLSPPASRSSSPSKLALRTPAKLVIEPAVWEKMDIGKDLEHIDATDETSNSKYNGKSTMEIYGLFDDQTIILEEQTGGPAGGEFSSDNKKKSKFWQKKSSSKPASTTASRTASPGPGMTTRGRTRRDGRTRGTIGLSNLGNTCYMNSALQCIRSVQELAIYFLQDKYKKEINASNPLGHGGAMAKKYAEVLNGIYSDTASGSFSPSNFKKTLGSVMPIFSGYGQQDSQEFLSFLVDALHEDLNRIDKKPYLENPDSDDFKVNDKQYIRQLGETYRSNHRQRNDSIAMDLFNGFYKNTMECPECDKVSVTFDPYSLLTVQLPVENTLQHRFTFVPLVGTPVNHMMDLEKNLTVKEVKKKIAEKHAGVDPKNLWMVEVYSHKLYKFFEDKISLAEAGIQTNDFIFVFELAAPPTNVPAPKKQGFYGSSYGNKLNDEIPEMDSPLADRFAVPIFHRQKGRYGNSWQAIMHPQYIVLTREEAQSYEVILKKVLVACQQLTSRPILKEADRMAQKPAVSEPDADGEADASNDTSDDAGRISDRSVESEEDYVNVSLDKPTQQANGDVPSAGAVATTDDKMPTGFMDPQYFVPPILRNQLFVMNFAKANETLLSTGMSGFADNSVRSMQDRVKLPARRDSTDSSSTEDSTTSTASGQGEVEETEESDVDEGTPSLTNGESPLTLEEADTEDDTNTLPDNPLQPASRGGRRKGNDKGNKFKSGRKKKPKTYSRKERGQQNRPGSRGSMTSQKSHRSLNGKHTQQDDNPYYIKLGEPIVLDWHSEALDSLYGGSKTEGDDLRGTYLSNEDGKNLPIVADPEVEEKKKRREHRRTQGITLEDCFAETGKREKLSEDNAWYCNRCKELRQAHKSLEIWTIPDILVVHLKRFGGNRTFRDKIEVLVDYPAELDMTDRIGVKEEGKEYMYDLFAVDLHFGGLGGGHYTACAKNFFDGQWYDYNGEQLHP